MKKLIAALLVLALVLGLTACRLPVRRPAEQTQATVPVTVPTTLPEPEVGSVYYMNVVPEADRAWRDLAASYQSRTGIEVRVVTLDPASYGEILAGELKGTEAPTLFHITDGWGLEQWGDYCLDLSGTQAVSEQTTGAVNLYEGNKLKGLGISYESYGLIVNKTLLKQAGYKLEDIRDFDSLSDIAWDVSARSASLGFDAFPKPDLEEEAGWQFISRLANGALYYEWKNEGYTEAPAAIKGSSLELVRNVWDLYHREVPAQTESTEPTQPTQPTQPAEEVLEDPETAPAVSTGDRAKDDFAAGKVLFYQGGSWEYEFLAKEQKLDVAMVPMYMGADGEENAGLCLGTEHCLAVNAQASQKDIEATLDFLYWVVTSWEGAAMLAEQFGASPFRAVEKSENAFLTAAEETLTGGKYALTWNPMHKTANLGSWKTEVIRALEDYTWDPTEEAWEEVVSAFTEGWEIDYALITG